MFWISIHDLTEVALSWVPPSWQPLTFHKHFTFLDCHSWIYWSWKHLSSKHFERDSELNILAARTMLEKCLISQRLMGGGISHDSYLRVVLVQTVVQHGNCGYSVYALKLRFKRQSFFRESAFCCQYSFIRSLYNCCLCRCLLLIVAGIINMQPSLHRRTKYGSTTL